MPSLKLTNLLSYKNYFKDLAEKHVDIDGFKWGDDKVIQNDSRSNITRNFLWAVPYEDAKYGDAHSDNIVKRKLARVSYMEARDSKKFSLVEAQFERCEAVMEQIVARILRDKRGAEVAGVWTMLATDVNSFKTMPIESEFSSTPYIGCELQMEFMDNANLAFDAQKWSDTLIP